MTPWAGGPIGLIHLSVEDIPYLCRKIDIIFIRGGTGRMGGLTLANAMCSADHWSMKGFRTSFEKKN